MAKIKASGSMVVGPDKIKQNVRKPLPAFVAKDGFVTLNTCGPFSNFASIAYTPHATDDIRSSVDTVVKTVFTGTKARRLSSTPYINKSIANTLILGSYAKMPVLSAFEWILWSGDIISKSLNYILPSAGRSIASILLNSMSGYSVMLRDVESKVTTEKTLEFDDSILKLITATDAVQELARNTSKIDLESVFGNTPGTISVEGKTENRGTFFRNSSDLQYNADSLKNFSQYVIGFLYAMSTLKAESSKTKSNILSLVDLGVYQGSIPKELLAALMILTKIETIIKLFAALSDLEVSDSKFWTSMDCAIHEKNSQKITELCCASMGYSFESFWLAPEYRESIKVNIPVFLASYLPSKVKSSLGVSTVDEYLTFAKVIRAWMIEQKQLQVIKEALQGSSNIVEQTEEGPVFTDALLSIVTSAIFDRTEAMNLLAEEEALFNYKEGKIAEAFAHFMLADAAGLNLPKLDYHKYMPLAACLLEIDDESHAPTIYGPAQGDRMVKTILESIFDNEGDTKLDTSIIAAAVGQSVSKSTSKVMFESYANPEYLRECISADLEKFGRYFDFHIEVILQKFYEPAEAKELPTFTPKYFVDDQVVYCERLEANMLTAVSHGAAKFSEYSLAGEKVSTLATRSGDGSIFSDSINDDFDIIQEAGVILPPNEPKESMLSSVVNPIEKPIPGFLTDCGTADGIYVDDDCKVIYHFGPTPVLKRWPFALKVNDKDVSAVDAIIMMYKFKALISCGHFEYSVNENSQGETVLRKAYMRLILEPISLKPPISSKSALKFNVIGLHTQKENGYKANSYLTVTTELNPAEIGSWSLTQTLFTFSQTDIDAKRSSMSLKEPSDSILELYLNRFKDITTGNFIFTKTTPTSITVSVEPMAVKTQFAVNGLARGKVLSLEKVDPSMAPKPVVSLAYGLPKQNLSTETDSKDGISKKVKRNLRWSTTEEPRYFRMRWLQPVQELPEHIADMVRDNEEYILRMPGKNPGIDAQLKVSSFSKSPIFAEMYLCVDMKYHGYKAARDGINSNSEKLATIGQEEKKGNKVIYGLPSNEALQAQILPIAGLFPKTKSTWITLYNPLHSCDESRNKHVATWIRPKMYLKDQSASPLYNVIWLVRELIRDLDFFFCGLPSYTGEKTKYPLQAVFTQLVDFVECSFDGIGSSVYLNDFGCASGMTLRQAKAAVAKLCKTCVKYTDKNSTTVFERAQDELDFTLEKPIELNDNNILMILKSLRGIESSESANKLMDEFVKAIENAYTVLTGMTHERTLYFTHVPGTFVATNLLYDSVNSLANGEWNYWDLPQYGAKVDACVPGELGLNLTSKTQARVVANFNAHGIQQVVNWLVGDTAPTISDDIAEFLADQESKIGIEESSFLATSIPTPSVSSTSVEKLSYSLACVLNIPEVHLAAIGKVNEVDLAYDSKSKVLIITGSYSERKLAAIAEKLINDEVVSVAKPKEFALKFKGPKFLSSLLAGYKKSYTEKELDGVLKELSDTYKDINSAEFWFEEVTTGEKYPVDNNSKEQSLNNRTKIFIYPCKDISSDKLASAAVAAGWKPLTDEFVSAGGDWSKLEFGSYVTALPVKLTPSECKSYGIQVLKPKDLSTMLAAKAESNSEQGTKPEDLGSK